ncbi:RTA1-domain-containing protein, partial [Tricladium varicosporioides]
YCPSVPAAIAFFALFMVSTLCHLFQAVKWRKSFCWVLIMGGIWETFSFALRITSAHDPTKKAIYDISFLLLIISPLLINAFDYVLLGRMVTFFLGDVKLVGIRGSKMGIIFVCFDVVSFIIQIGGGLLSLSTKAKDAKLGLHVYTGGVVFQQLLIICFLMLTISFQRKLRYKRGPKKHGSKTLLNILRVSLALITYRIIFRIVEFSSPQGSKVNLYINKHEFFVYVFDAGPMFFALVLMNIWHPGKVMQNDYKKDEYSSQSNEGLALQGVVLQRYDPQNYGQQNMYGYAGVAGEAR